MPDVKDDIDVRLFGHPGFLGDPTVVQSLLRSWTGAVMTGDHSDWPALKKRIDDSSKKIAHVLLGGDKRFPGNPWNSPGQIDAWVARQENIQADDPVERVATALLGMLHELYDLQTAMNDQRLVREQWQPTVTAIFEDYTRLLLGLPRDTGQDEDDGDGSDTDEEGGGDDQDEDGDTGGGAAQVQESNFNPAQHPRGQPENKGEFAANGTGQSDGKSKKGKPSPKDKESAPVKRAAPGSQIPEAQRTKLRALGMVGTFPPADVPMSDVKIADLERSAKALKFSPLMSWTQKTRSGRVSRQYRYTQEFHDRNAGEKFERVEAIEPHIGKIKERLATQMADSALPLKDREAAAIANVIRETGLRPTDGEESVKHGHFGISSLQARHAKVAGEEVHLDFIGKEGVRNQTIVREPENVAFLKEALGRAKGDDFLFQNATSDHAGDTLKAASLAAGGPENIKIKDLRTLKATQTARQVVAAFSGPPPPLTGDKAKDAKALVAAILKMSGAVAQVLNNTPQQAKTNYIHPRIFEEWQLKLSAAS